MALSQNLSEIYENDCRCDSTKNLKKIKFLESNNQQINRSKSVWYFLMRISQGEFMQKDWNQSIK